MPFRQLFLAHASGWDEHSAAIHSLARFDVALASVERPKGPKGAGICLAQAEGLGNLCEVCLKGRRSDRLLRA